MTPMSGVLLNENSGQSTAQGLISSMTISFWEVITKTNHQSYIMLWQYTAGVGQSRFVGDFVPSDEAEPSMSISGPYVRL